MFNQLKSITRSTSNHDPNQMLTNILVRIEEEYKAHTNRSLSCLKGEDNEVSKLQQCWSQNTNTVIPRKWLEQDRPHYQAHLERICDYLVEGPNAWWKHTTDGVEFFDATNLPQSLLCKHLYRSSNLSRNDTFLMEQWKKCIELNITLPCKTVRTFM